MADTLLLTIEQQYNQLPKTQQKIASYILNHAELVPNMTTRELAEKSAVSEASVNRFPKAIGIESLDFRCLSLPERSRVFGDQNIRTTHRKIS